jgi:4-hydroxy-2-oxoheptanedioate aldolase
MVYANPLLARWRAGDTTFGLWATTASPALGEYAASTGVDWILWDMQHGLISDTDLPDLFRSVLGRPVIPLVRVGANDSLLIGRALDAGSAGVIVPLVNTPEEAAASVSACRFPPVGTRSFGPNRATLVTGTLDPRVIEQVACVVMVETATGLANVEAIAATPGVDAILIGPSDLALGLGLAHDDRSTPHVDAVRRILDACRANGLAAGIVLGSGEAARKHAEMGFQFINVASDVGLVTEGLRRELRVARGG